MREFHEVYFVAQATVTNLNRLEAGSYDVWLCRDRGRADMTEDYARREGFDFRPCPRALERMYDQHPYHLKIVPGSVRVFEVRQQRRVEEFPL